jgi:arylsulfatase
MKLSSAVCVASTFLLVALASGAPAATAASRPNVIVVLSDDQGYGDFSCTGNPVLKTPHLDRLHDQGVRLTDFHVAPMCTPTRGQLMTGVDALRNGASSVCAGRSYIRRGIPTMAEIFRSGGYQTGHFGKWHLGDSYPNLPQQRGFGETVYFLGWGITAIADVWKNDCFDGQFRHNGVLAEYPGYCTDVWFDLAKDFIRQQKQAQQPFFVYLPTNAAHGPHWVPDKYKEPYQGRGPANFFAMLANLDENMGKLDEFLRQSDLYDNTIVIFLNDNGGTAGVKLFNAGMRGHKTEYYDGGHRAACFIRWPAGPLRKGADVGAVTQVQDLLPTLIDLCDLPTPKSAKFDGTNLAPVLKDKNAKLADRMLVVQYGQEPVKDAAAVLWDQWRLVHGNELYDIQADPGQKHDVADDQPQVARQMREHYDSWWAEIEPLVNDFSPVSIGAAQENPVRLTSADWANVYCDNMHDLRKGKPTNAPWHVLVEQDGQYEIGLRRWPVEADAPIAAGVPPFEAVQGGLPAGQALPIAKIRLKIGGLDETKPVGPNDRQVPFTVRLKQGERLQMQSWCYDADGRELCGAYFAYVWRK